MYDKTIKSGHNYDKLEKTIVILITDYELEGIKKVEKYSSKWNIREEDYHQIILTDLMEIYIIELPKLERYKEKVGNKTLNLWTKFIKNPEVIKIEDMSEELKKARAILEDISSSEHDRYLAELREKYILDQRDIELAGYDKGRKKKAEEIAKK